MILIEEEMKLESNERSPRKRKKAFQLLMLLQMG